MFASYSTPLGPETDWSKRPLAADVALAAVDAAEAVGRAHGATPRSPAGRLTTTAGRGRGGLVRRGGVGRRGAQESGGEPLGDRPQPARDILQLHGGGVVGGATPVDGLPTQPLVLRQQRRHYLAILQGGGARVAALGRAQLLAQEGVGGLGRAGPPRRVDVVAAAAPRLVDEMGTHGLDGIGNVGGVRLLHGLGGLALCSAGGSTLTQPRREHEKGKKKRRNNMAGYGYTVSTDETSVADDAWKDPSCYRIVLLRHHVPLAQQSILVDGQYGGSAEGPTVDEPVKLDEGDVTRQPTPSWHVWKLLKEHQLRAAKAGREHVIVPVGTPKGCALTKLALALLRLAAEWEMECLHHGPQFPRLHVLVPSMGLCQDLQTLLDIQISERHPAMHFANVTLAPGWPGGPKKNNHGPPDHPGASGPEHFYALLTGHNIEAARLAAV